MLESILEWYQKCRRQPLKHPRANFLLDFLQDLALITTVNVAVKMFYLVVGGLTALLPSFGNPADFGSYSPLDLTRTLVTVSDAVSILAFTIIATATLVKFALVQFRGLSND